jgi:histidyl-tRNA synthetase
MDAFSLCVRLRDGGVKADSDHLARSLKAQFRYADKLGVRFMIVLGADEAARGAAKVKAMDGGAEEEIALDTIADYLKKRLAE